MFTILSSKKRKNIKRLENKLFLLVDKKETRNQMIDDYGRSLVLTLREYMQNQKVSIKYRAMMKEVKQYIKKNQGLF